MKSITLYNISDDMPVISQLPLGQERYDKLFNYHSKDDLKNIIDHLISDISISLNIMHIQNINEYVMN